MVENHCICYEDVAIIHLARILKFKYIFALQSTAITTNHVDFAQWPLKTKAT